MYGKKPGRIAPPAHDCSRCSQWSVQDGDWMMPMESTEQDLLERRQRERREMTGEAAGSSSSLSDGLYSGKPCAAVLAKVRCCIVTLVLGRFRRRYFFLHFLATLPSLPSWKTSYYGLLSVRACVYNIYVDVYIHSVPPRLLRVHIIYLVVRTYSMVCILY